MLMRFTGKYTGGRSSVLVGGIAFTGREPSEVPDDSALLRHPELEPVEALKPPVQALAGLKRGRPRKAA